MQRVALRTSCGVSDSDGMGVSRLAFSHGGDWAGFLQEYGVPPRLDMSSNVSPLGLPQRVRHAAEAAVSAADRYPDPLCRELRHALARIHGVPPTQIVCGNGAADLIFRLVFALRPKRVLRTAPGFLEYHRAAALWGSEEDLVFLKETEAFLLPDRILEQITPETELVILGNPNNPDGRTVPLRLLNRVLEVCAENHAVLLLDECFLPFLDHPEDHTPERDLERFPGLVLLRAFTKSHGMAGLRLGYAMFGSEKLADSVASAGPPWAVSAVAQAAGMAALQEAPYLKRLRTLIASERPRMKAALEDLGCRVVPGEANFLLFFCPDPNLAGVLRKKGILLRNCQTFEGLAPGWFRTAIRTPGENTLLLQEMKSALGL